MDRLTLKIIAVSIVAAFIFGTFTFSDAQESYMKGKRLAICDYSADVVRIIEKDGTINRTDRVHLPNDIQSLPKGHLLYTTGNGIREVDGEGKTVLEYKCNSEVYSMQRLPNGNTFVNECSSGRLTTLDANGKIVKQIETLPGHDGGHLYTRIGRILDNGHYLLSRYSKKRVVELDENGKEVWFFDAPFGVHGVARLKNGNTVITSGDFGASCLWEIAPDKTVVWKVDNNDLPGKPLRYVGGFNVMPNGNYVICNWLGHNHFKEAPHLLEINRDKKIVWQFSDFDNFKTISSFDIIEKR